MKKIFFLILFVNFAAFTFAQQRYVFVDTEYILTNTHDEVFLSLEMRTKRIKEIKEKEYQVQKLQQLYFGSNGELYKKRQSLVQPIQEKIYQAVEELARKGNYGMVIDQAAAPVILWSQPKYDKSDKILEMILGKGVKLEE